MSSGTPDLNSTSEQSERDVAPARVWNYAGLVGIKPPPPDF